MQQNERKISLVVIRRLPRYYRYLGDLLAQDIRRISSKELSRRMKVTASQIRQDLNCFGGFGQQGYGYNVEELYEEIGEILGIRDEHDVIIVGAGHLGHALANHGGFAKRGFNISAIFDVDPHKIGKRINGVVVRDMSVLEAHISAYNTDIAILAVTKSETKAVADRLIKAGVKGFLNFSYVDLDAPDDVVVENVHLSDSLMTLSYRLQEKTKEIMMG